MGEVTQSGEKRVHTVGKQKKNLVRVPGARKVWGTLRATTVVAVRNVISSVAKIPIDDLVVKRKYQSESGYGSISRWWFVIRGKEDVLEELQAKWSSVSLQTAWKLVDVYSYADTGSDHVDSLSPTRPSTDLPSHPIEAVPGNNDALAQFEVNGSTSTHCPSSDNTIPQQCPTQDISEVPQCSIVSASGQSSATEANEESNTNGEASKNSSGHDTSSPLFLDLD